MTLGQCKAQLKRLGLNLVLEKDATIGYEYLVEDDKRATVACGYHEGTKTDAAHEALRHPAIAMRLRSAQVQP